MIKVAVIGKTPENWQSEEATLNSDALFDKIKLALLNLSREETVWLISPMNRGIEIMAAQLAVLMGENIMLECALPFEEQAKDWSETDRERYYDTIVACEKENLLATAYTPKCEALCYRYVINSANLILLGTPPSDEVAELIQNSGKRVIEI